VGAAEAQGNGNGKGKEEGKDGEKFDEETGMQMSRW